MSDTNHIRAIKAVWRTPMNPQCSEEDLMAAAYAKRIALVGFPPGEWQVTAEGLETLKRHSWPRRAGRLLRRLATRC